MYVLKRQYVCTWYINNNYPTELFGSQNLPSLRVENGMTVKITDRGDLYRNKLFKQLYVVCNVF